MTPDNAWWMVPAGFAAWLFICWLLIGLCATNSRTDPEPDDDGPDCDYLADQPTEVWSDAEYAYRFHQIMKRHTFEELA